MSRPKVAKTIDKILDEFLAEQRTLLARSTLSKYETVIHLYKSYMESYWPGHEHGEYDKITDAGGTYCGTFGAGDIREGFGEFLDYFLPRKVIGAGGATKAAGTVVKKLNKWLVEKGYCQTDEMVSENLKEIGRDLGPSQDLCDRLSEWVLANEPSEYGETVEDHFIVSKVEPGQIWLEPMMSAQGTLGPIPIPKAISKSCKVGWDLGGAVAKTARGWRLVEVWNVSP